MNANYSGAVRVVNWPTAIWNRLAWNEPIEGLCTSDTIAPPRMSWACLLKRVFDIDVEHCPNCGGCLKIIAAIVDAAVMTKILTRLHLPARAPPRSPALRVDLFQAA